MVMFFKPSSILYKELTHIDIILAYNLKDFKDITIGQDVKDHIVSSKYPSEKVLMYKSIQKFLSVAVRYLLKNLPLSEPLLINAEVADIPHSQMDDNGFSKLNREISFDSYFQSVY